MVASMTPLSDFTYWARLDGLEIMMLLIIAAFIVSRPSFSISRSLTAPPRRSPDPGGDGGGRSQVANPRHAVPGIVRGVFVSLLYVIVISLVLERLGVPLSTLVAPAAALGVGLGFGRRRHLSGVSFAVLHLFRAPVRLWRHGGDQGHHGCRRHLQGASKRCSLRVTHRPTLMARILFVPNEQDPPCLSLRPLHAIQFSSRK